jgi:serine/threonine-protein kinase
MAEEGGTGPSGASDDDDALLRAIARAPSLPLDGSAEVDPVRVAHFKISGRLGSGGMGVVYRAQDESLRREVALKLLPAVSSGNPERRQRFLREARVAASLVHPNVAVVHQVGEADGRVYIAMELVEGITLRQRLESGPVFIPVVRELALQIAQGLAAAHAKGVVHRDLKPENVMVTDAGTVKLLDFGLAKSGWASDSDSALANADTEAQITREGDVLGSSAYMSPEQALGMNVDARSDVFSFGIVLYEMITGRRPFVGRSLGEIRAAIAREQPVPLGAGADPGLAAIVRKCLEKRAEDRYVDAGVVVLELAALPTASGVAHREDVTSPLPSAPRTRRPWLWSLVGLVAAVLAGSLLATRHYGARRTDATVAANAVPQAAVDAAASLPYDDGGNPSKNPEAQRLYEQALAAFHGGTESTRSLLMKAVELDPSFGAAHLRLLVTKYMDWHTRYRATVENEATLSERDKTVFATLHEGYSPPDARLQASKKQLEEYLAVHPRDEFARWARIIFSMNDGEHRCDYLNQVIADQPSFLTPFADAATYCLKQRRGRSPEALALIDQCLKTSPGATKCLAARVELDERADDCVQLDVDARRLLALDPESREGREGLANALASQGSPIDAVREAIGTLDESPLSRSTSPWYALRAWYVPMLDGNFPEAERVADAALQAAGATKDGDRMLAPGSALIDAYTESGDPAAAARVAERLLAVVRSTCDWCDSSDAITAMARGGRTSRTEANEQLAAWYQKVARVSSRYQAWARIYGRSARDRADAETALAVFERDVPPSEESAKSTTLATVYMLAGRTADARRIYDGLGGVCAPATETLGVMKEQLYRGRLDEESGNTPSACAHYAKILERWGHAKPRSVTADEARAHATKLGCPSP